MSSEMQGLHQVAQKLIITGLPSLLSCEVLKILPSSVFTSTAGSLRVFSVVCAWAANTIRLRQRLTNTFFMIEGSVFVRVNARTGCRGSRFHTFQIILPELFF